VEPEEPFRILEHPADVGFEAVGKTPAEVFVNAALALTHLRVDLDTVSIESALDLSVSGQDWPGLLVNWLSEILYLQDAEGWLLRRFDIGALTDTSLSVTGRGQRFNPARHRLKALVKAVTYHQLLFAREGSLWRARVFVDV